MEPETVLSPPSAILKTRNLGHSYPKRKNFSHLSSPESFWFSSLGILLIRISAPAGKQVSTTAPVFNVHVAFTVKCDLGSPFSFISLAFSWDVGRGVGYVLLLYICLSYDKYTGMLHPEELKMTSWQGE